MEQNTINEKIYRRNSLFYQLNNEIQPKFSKFNVSYIQDFTTQKPEINKKFEIFNQKDSLNKILKRKLYKII